MATKTSQVGAELGLLVVGGLRVKSLRVIKGGFRGGTIGLVVGFLMGLLLFELAMRGQEDEQIYDGVLRIRYNQGQIKMNWFFFFGALAVGILLGPGFLTGALLPQPVWGAAWELSLLTRE